MSLQAKALAVFGERRQLLALAEEMNEASAAVLRLLNDKPGAREALLEELVDVESVILSLRDAIGSPDDWAEMREAKALKLAAVPARQGGA